MHSADAQLLCGRPALPARKAASVRGGERQLKALLVRSVFNRSRTVARTQAGIRLAAMQKRPGGGQYT